MFHIKLGMYFEYRNWLHGETVCTNSYELTAIDSVYFSHLLNFILYTNTRIVTAIRAQS